MPSVSDCVTIRGVEHSVMIRPNPRLGLAMFKRNCVVKFVDNFGVEHAANIEAESLFEAAVRGLRRLDSSFWTEEDVFDRMCITVEVHERPTIHTGMVANLKRWIKSHGRHPREEAKKEELRRLLFGTRD